MNSPISPRCRSAAASHRVRLLMGAVLAAALCTGPSRASAQARPERLVLSTLEDAVGVEIGIVVLREAYGRLGIALEIQRFAGPVALDRAATGAVDGDVQRVDGMQLRYPDLIQVPVPVSFTDIVVFSRDSALRVRTVSDLRPLRVATVRGIPAIERTVGDLPIRLVDTYAELWPLLMEGDVDAVVATGREALVARAGGALGRDVVRNAVLDSHLQYHYLHRRHAGLVPVIAPILREMVLDGTVARLRAAVVERLTSGPAGRGAR